MMRLEDHRSPKQNIPTTLTRLSCSSRLLLITLGMQSLQNTTRRIDNVSQELVYANGTGASGSLLRQKTASYLHVNPVNGVDYSNTGSPHILDRKTNEQILTPSGTKMSET